MALDMHRLNSLSIEELEALADSLGLQASHTLKRVQTTHNPIDRRNYTRKAQEDIRNAERIINLALRKALGR